MLTHNAAATHRADAQLLRAALLADLSAVVDILICRPSASALMASAIIRAVPLGASSLL